MMKLEVRYIDEARASDRLVVHPADEMRAKRDLAGKPFVDDEYRLYYQTWLASKRAGITEAAQDFDTWLETIAEVEPRLTLKQVQDAVLAGAVTEEQAVGLRAQIAQEDAEGESAAPPS